MKNRVVVAPAILALKVALFAAFIFLAQRRSSVDASDNGKSVTISKGECLILKLPGNPTTGYTWEVLAIDPHILKQDGRPEINLDSDAIGSGGTLTLKFQAINTGESQIKLVYHRPWETDVAPIDTFEINIVIK